MRGKSERVRSTSSAIPTMQTAVFPTPEEAAMSGFPAEHCRVLASATEGDAAYVVLDTGPAGYPYLYGGTAGRVEGGWTDGTSGNGPGSGWTRTGERGVSYVYDHAPAGADRVRAAHGGEVREVDVERGVFLVTWWDVPEDADLTPVLLAFRVDGEWRDFPDDGGTWRPTAHS